LSFKRAADYIATALLSSKMFVEAGLVPDLRATTRDCPYVHWCPCRDDSALTIYATNLEI
jgi:hypothetical protein